MSFYSVLSPHRLVLNDVGATGFEPATTPTPRECATGLRYAPNPPEADSPKNEKRERSLA